MINNYNLEAYKNSIAKGNVTSPISINRQGTLAHNSNASSFPPLENDTFESSRKTKLFKNENHKKIAIVASGIALTALSVVGALHLNKIGKAKKEITKIYDGVFEIMKKQYEKTGIEFVKPQLKFKRIKGAIAGLNPGQGTITVNTNVLDRKNIVTYKDGCGIKELKDGKKLYTEFFTRGKFEAIPDNMSIISKEEYLANLAATMQHELTHAMQEQKLLSYEGGLEKLLSAYKKAMPKFADITMEEFTKTNLFYRTYKPKSKISSDVKFSIKLPFAFKEKKYEYKYGLDDIVNAFANYTSEDSTKYFNNMLEVEARIGEAWSINNLKKLFPNINFSDDLVEKKKIIKMHNLVQLLGLNK